jgi:hypothetical protein
MIGSRSYSSRAFASAVCDTSSKTTRQPAVSENGANHRCRPEVENGRAGGQLQPLHQHGHVDQQRRRFVRLAEWLRQLDDPNW